MLIIIPYRNLPDDCLSDLSLEDTSSVSQSDVEKMSNELGSATHDEITDIKNISKVSVEAVQDSFPTEETAPSEEQYIPTTPNADSRSTPPISPTGNQEKIARRNLDAVFSVIDNNPTLDTFSSGNDRTSASYLAVHPEEWRALFADAEGRRHFLQILDERRGRSSSLHPSGFKALTTAMQVCCLHDIDIYL